jgi:hypothetical protein
MANVDVPKGKMVPKVTKNLDKEHGPKPYDGQDLKSNAHVYKPASSDLMAGMSQSRGKGGAK